MIIKSFRPAMISNDYCKNNVQKINELMGGQAEYRAVRGIEITDVIHNSTAAQKYSCTHTEA